MPFDKAYRLSDAIFGAEGKPQLAGPQSKGGAVHLGQGCGDLFSGQMRKTNRCWAGPYRRDALSPELLVDTVRNDDGRNPSAQTGSCRPRPTVMDNGATAGKKPVVRCSVKV